MTSFVRAILILLLSYPSYKGNTETFDQELARLERIARAFDTASYYATCAGQYAREGCRRIWHGSRTDLVLALATRARYESDFSQRVHEGKCEPWECDPVKKKDGTIYHKARTIFQLQWERTYYREWHKMVGSDYVSTTYAAIAASRKLAQTLAICREGKGVSACRTATAKRSKRRLSHYYMLDEKFGPSLRRAERNGKK